MTTLILQNSIELDEDLLAYSARSIETLVSVGMQLGVSVKVRVEHQLPDIKNCVLGVWKWENAESKWGTTR